MEVIYLCKKKCVLLLCFLWMSLCVFAQDKKADTATQKPVDSIASAFLLKVKKKGEENTKKSINRFNRVRIAIKQETLIENIRKNTFKAQEFIKAGIDTVGINNELEYVKALIIIVGDGIFTNKGTRQTFRNLTTTTNILRELLNQVNTQKELIDKYEKDLVGFRFKIDSLSADTDLYNIPKDSVQAREYVIKLNSAAAEINPADTALTFAVNNIHKLQTKVHLVAIKLTSNLEEIDRYQASLSANTFKREFANLGDDVGYSRPFGQILYFSYLKAKLNFSFYTRNNPARLFLLFLLIAGSMVFLSSLRQMALRENEQFDDLSGYLVLQHPKLSAMVIVLSLGQFIFPQPPFIFDCFFWLIPAACLTFIFRTYITRYGMMVWLIFSALFLIACADNLVLQASRVERWGMLVLAIAGCVFGALIILKGKNNQLREKLILYFIGLAVVLELVSVFANLSGRYNLAKTLLVSGYLNVVIGILFLWTVRLINQGLYVASKAYTKPDKRLFYINFDTVGEKAPTLLYILLVAGWFILLGRNFYIFRLISTPVRSFFFDEHTIGDYSFTVNSILIFFLIIGIATVSSKIVSYFASDKASEPVTAAKVRKSNLGSWLLLIRVTIMSVGLFLALAASGFPVERITVVIGALGLGIGLGLQALVNNLVSGLIISFEKPVNVGDIVEISGQGGTVKSIGFRSSIISKWDGPDMVIPNGDLLNAHLVNWTMAGSKRQVEIVVGVAYGTDLSKPQSVIRELLSANDRIHEHPQPSVLFQNFSDSAIDVKVVFWVRDFKDGASVKSETIMAIDAAFKKEGIVIPFPQQDVHVIGGDKREKSKS
jgi:potassium efflux system protein